MIAAVGLLLILIHLSTEAETFYRTTVGEYYVQWKAFGACPPEKRGTNEIFTDYHLSKRRPGFTEMFGKTTLRIPFDDNVTIDMNFNVLGSNSAWLPNAHHLNVPRACTTMLSVFKEGWAQILKIQGVAPKCPVPKGVYELKDYDITNFMRYSVLPKQFIFGQYKIVNEYLRFGKLVGCSYAVVELVPAWQRKTGKNNRTSGS